MRMNGILTDGRSLEEEEEEEEGVVAVHGKVIDRVRANWDEVKVCCFHEKGASRT